MWWDASLNYNNRWRRTSETEKLDVCLQCCLQKSWETSEDIFIFILLLVVVVILLVATRVWSASLLYSVLSTVSLILVISIFFALCLPFLKHLGTSKRPISYVGKSSKVQDKDHNQMLVMFSSRQVLISPCSLHTRYSTNIRKLCYITVMYRRNLLDKRFILNSKIWRVLFFPFLFSQGIYIHINGASVCFVSILLHLKFA